MGDVEISSDVFYAAELRSERIRIFGLLAFFAAVFVVLTVRVFLLHTTVFSPQVALKFTLMVALCLFEYLILRLVNRALDRNRKFPRLLWLTSTVVEMAVPAIGVAWLTTTDFASAYRPLASPATLLFFVFIILSILRLDPWICRLAGITAERGSDRGGSEDRGDGSAAGRAGIPEDGAIPRWSQSFEAR